MIPAFTALTWCGCGRDARLAGESLRNPTVRTVSHYGLTLDASAPPEKVAAAALRAIREDVLAKSTAERKAAQDIQFDLCAADVIAARNSTGLTRNEFVHYVVTEWAPTISFYVGDLDSDVARLAGRMTNRGSTRSGGDKQSECELAMEVESPDGDVNGKTVMLIWMARDHDHWRVSHFGFEPWRSLAVKTVDTPSNKPVDN